MGGTIGSASICLKKWTLASETADTLTSATNTFFAQNGVVLSRTAHQRYLALGNRSREDKRDTMLFRNFFAFALMMWLLHYHSKHMMQSSPQSRCSQTTPRHPTSSMVSLSSVDSNPLANLTRSTQCSQQPKNIGYHI